MKLEQNNNFDENMYAITNEVQNINEQIRERKDIYRKCLCEFKKHLSKQAADIERTQMASEQKNMLIRNSYQQIYHNINQDRDIMLRYIRKTYQAKKQFWKQTIREMANDPDLDLKRDLHLAKSEAYENYLEAIDQRKTKPITYTRLVSFSEPDQTLINFKEKNRVLQADVYAGTLLRMTQTMSLAARDQFDNKQNSMYQNWGQKGEIVNLKKEDQYSQDILKRFMRN